MWFRPGMGEVGNAPIHERRMSRLQRTTSAGRPPNEAERSTDEVRSRTDLVRSCAIAQNGTRQRRPPRRWPLWTQPDGPSKGLITSHILQKENPLGAIRHNYSPPARGPRGMCGCLATYAMRVQSSNVNLYVVVSALTVCSHHDWERVKFLSYICTFVQFFV